MYPTGLSCICYFFFLWSLFYYLLRWFFLSDHADTAASCSFIKCPLGDTALTSAYHNLDTTAAAPTAACTETFNSSSPGSCLPHLSGWIHTYCLLSSKERRRWRLNFDDWKWMLYKALDIQMWLYFEIFFPPVLDILLALNCRLTLEIGKVSNDFEKPTIWQNKVIVAQKISFLGWYGADFLQVFTGLWIFWPWIRGPS